MNCLRGLACDLLPKKCFCKCVGINPQGFLVEKIDSQELNKRRRYFVYMERTLRP